MTPRLRTVGMTDVVSQLPGPQRLELDFIDETPTADLFLCAVGFEPRVLSIPDWLITSGFRARRIICCEYSTNPEDNAAYRPQLLARLRRIGPPAIALEVDSPQFSARLMDLIASQGADKRLRIVLDASVAANRVLIKTIACVMSERQCDLTVLYAEAAVYHPTEQAFRRDREKLASAGSVGLDFGVGEVTIASEEFPGFQIDQLPDCVALIPGFNRHRSRAVISAIDSFLLNEPGAKRVHWLVGVPHLPEDAWRTEALKIVNDISDVAPQHAVSTFDYRETVRVLERIYQETAAGFRLTVSPMGSKMQALGAAIFGVARPDVRILFARPREYSAVRYSEGCKAVWRVSFGGVDGLMRQLDAVDSVVIE